MTVFRCYISLSGDGEVCRWYKAQSPNLRGAIFAVIKLLDSRPRHHWRRKLYGVLRGQSCQGLSEIRIEEPKGSHHRLLGFFVAPDEHFVLLYAFAKDSDPAYETACPETQRRKAEIEQDNTRAQDCEFPTPG
jgi:hypothetical protein